MSETTLTGKVALITGGAVRVGRAIALSLARRGCRILVHYNRSETPAQQTVEELTALGVESIALQADLAEPVTAAGQLFHDARDAFGHVDLLINNASLFEPGTLADSTEDLWDRTFAVNLKAPWFLSREFAKQSVPGNDPQIINLCDWRTDRLPPGHDVYTLTKVGLTAMTKLLAKELAPAIRVNGIAPGAVLPADDNPDDHTRRSRATIPLERLGTPEDVARGVLFLAESPFITGEVLNITGGEHL